MSVRTKIVFSLIGTLLIGAVLGALLLGAVSQYRTQQTENVRTPDGFSEAIIAAAQPADDQERELRDALDRHGERMQAVREACHSDFRAAADSMRQDFRLLLADEQYERVMDRLGEMRDSHRERRRGGNSRR